MGIWYGPVLVLGSLLGFILFGYFAKWLFVDMLKVRESKIVTVLLVLFAVGFVAFLIANHDGKGRRIEPEPGIDYWIRR